MGGNGRIKTSHYAEWHSWTPQIEMPADPKLCCVSVTRRLSSPDRPPSKDQEPFLANLEKKQTRYPLICVLGPSYGIGPDDKDKEQKIRRPSHSRGGILRVQPTDEP